MKKAKILIVADDWHVAEDTKNILEDLGYVVPAIVSSVEEAIKKAEEYTPDLVLMDIVLKGKMDGIEAADQIHTQFNIPIVYLTAPADKELMDRAKITEPFGYITKPFEKEILHINIEIALYKHKMEKKLNENEERYRILIEAASFSGQAIMINQDREGIEASYAFANDAAKQITGYTDEELVKLSWFDILHPIYRDPARDRYRKRMAGEDIPDLFELSIFRKDGTETPIELSSIRTEFMGRNALVTFFRDITERKRAEEALRESEQKYKTITDSSLTGVFIHQDDRYVYVNDRFAETLGYAPEELLGKKHYEVIHPDHREMIKQRGHKRLKGEAVPKRYEIKKLRKDGKPVWHEIIVSDPINYRGKPAIMGHEIDITDRKQTEETLQRTKEELETIVDSVPAFIVYKDSNNRYIRINKTFADSINAPKDHIEGKSAFDMTPNRKLAEKYWRDDKEVMESAIPKRNIIEQPVTDETRWVQTDKIPYRNAKGDIVGVIGFGIDITSRVQAEMALQYRLEFENIITSISTHFINLPTDEIDNGINIALQKIGEFVDVDRSYVFQFYENGTKMDNTHEWCRKGVDPHIQRLKGLLVDNFPWVLEKIKQFKVVHIPRVADLPPEASAEKEEFQTEGIQSLIMVPMVYGGDVVGFLGFDSVRVEKTWLEDISALLRIVGEIFANALERKQAEEALRKSEERYRTLVENVPVAVYRNTPGPKGEFLMANPTFLKMFGLDSEEEFKEMSVADVYMNPKDRKGFSDNLLAKGNITEFEVQLRKKVGTLFWGSINARVVYDEKGKPAYFDCTIMDITEKKRLEEQLQRAHKMEAIGMLAGGVAHDLNNILAGLVSYPELLLMEIPQDSPLRKSILTIQKSGEKAAVIVQDLLTLARRGVAVTETVDLNQIISEYLESPVHERLKSFHPLVQVETNLETDLLNILGSPTHLSKTVMNLVSNATEAMPDGGKILISTENRYVDRPIKGYEDVQEGDYVILTISDAGVGISPTDIERIFEPFYTKKVMGRSGTGLGMTVVWGTVKDHKGYIDARSTEGKETVFMLYFPATRKELTIEKSMISIEDYMGKGETVLVVDDVDEQREIASQLLMKLGYTVTAVSSGEEAVKYLTKHAVNIIVLDMIMDPGIDGLDTYRQILELHPGQKAIIASGFSETDRVKKTQRLGAGAYVKKPFLLEKIGLAVKKELGKQNAMIQETSV